MRGVTINFPEGSTNVTFCVDLTLDDFVCESREDFGIQLLSTNPAFNTLCNTPRAIATVEDSTGELYRINFNVSNIHAILAITKLCVLHLFIVC